MTRSRLLEWLGVVVTCATAILAALVELFAVPLYSGATLIPLAVVAAVASNVLLPRLARALVPTTVAAVLPFAAWLIVVVVVGLMTRPEGDVVLPGGGSVQWVGLGVIFAGIVTGIATIVITLPPPTPRTAVRQPVKG
jgi:hypothetical protein